MDGRGGAFPGLADGGAAVQCGMTASDRSLALVVADTSQHALAAQALAQSIGRLREAGVPVSQLLIYSDRDAPWGGLPVRRIAPIGSLADYNRLVVGRLAQDLEASHALVIQYDGFVLDGREFSPHFWHHDWIGAPWPHLPDTPVGNGGFSWRSRRLVQAAAALPYPDAELAEDLFICRQSRAALEAQGLHWAPPGLAAHFSVESVAVPFPTFGFHGVFHLPSVYRAQPLWLIEQLSPRTLARWQALLRPRFAALGEAVLQAFEARRALAGDAQAAAVTA